MPCANRRSTGCRCYGQWLVFRRSVVNVNERELTEKIENPEMVRHIGQAIEPEKCHHHDRLIDILVNFLYRIRQALIFHNVIQMWGDQMEILRDHYDQCSKAKTYFPLLPNAQENRNSGEDNHSDYEWENVAVIAASDDGS